MKYYKKPDSSVWAFESDGSQDFLITEDMVAMTAEQVAAHTAPPPPVAPGVVSMRQARLALLAAELLDDVEAVVAAAPRATQIEWEFAATVQRDSPLVATLSVTLALDSARLDALFFAASTL